MHISELKSILIITSLLIILSGCRNRQEETAPVSILQLQEMSDMATVEFVVSKIVKASDDPSWFKYGDRKTLISVKANIKAGINMRLIDENDIEVSGSSIHLKLPAAHIISMNIAPEDIRQEYEYRGFFRSSFSSEERYRLLEQAQHQIRESTESMGVLRAAEENAVLFFHNWLRLMGYEQISVTVKGRTEPEFKFREMQTPQNPLLQ